MQVRAKLDGLWPPQAQPMQMWQRFSNKLVFKAWTSTGKIIGVWQSSAADPTQLLLVRVHDAASGALEQTIPLPRLDYERWAGMRFESRLKNFALSPTHEVLAIAHEIVMTLEATSSIWLVDLQSGTVTDQEVMASDDVNPFSISRISINMLSFSSDGKVLAMVTTDAGRSSGPQVWLLNAASGQTIMSSDLIGKRATSAPHHVAFILPASRMVLFQGSCSADDGEGCILHHVPAVTIDGIYGLQHPQKPFEFFVARSGLWRSG